MKTPRFLMGLLIGTGIGLIIWYWQKSTSAEEGALEVLDRLAAAEARVRDLEAQVRLARDQRLAAGQRASQEPSSTPDDLQVINGIGPVIARRLQDAGVRTFADLARQSPDRLRELAGLESWHAADPHLWINEASVLAGFPAPEESNGVN